MSDDDRSRSPENLKRSRSYNNDYESDDDRHQRSSKRRYNDRMELRLLIQSRDAGSIIGKGGDNIKRLREDFKVGITVSDSRAPERIVIISGELDGIGKVVESVLKGFDDFKTRRDEESELKMLIHQSQAGCVIGKAGSKLKEFRQDHSIDIKVYPECCPRSTERTVQITGKPHNVEKCVCSILDMLKTWPPKGTNHLYDPVNYMESSVREYGGYFGDFGRGGGGGRGRDRGRLGGGGLSRGSGFSGSGSRDRGSGSSSSASGPCSTQQVSIPANLAGVIIGKSGQNIKRIRQESGADVELSETSDGGSDRVITITGSASQIQNAQYLLQLSVKQHLERNE